MLRFERVIGGELPLSPDIAALWLEAEALDEAAIEALCGIYGGGADSAWWVRYGRSALGLALDLCGVGEDVPIGIPPYLCSVVLDKVLSRSANWHTYPLDDHLVPDQLALLEQGRVSRAIVTCVYFGSALIEQRLSESAEALWSLPGRPWIIEDRVMCFPDPCSVPLREGRCDFIIISFRKHYPVPDGALLIACSDRARQRMAELKDNYYSSGEGEQDGAVLEKVLAKVRRHEWLSSHPIVDDPALNGRNESIASEHVLDAFAAAPASDSLPGTSASARYLLGRSLMQDACSVKLRCQDIIDGLRAAGISESVLRLNDCSGIGVPLLVNGREKLKESMSAKGIFLPVHWPVGEISRVCSSARDWYAKEI